MAWTTLTTKSNGTRVVREFFNNIKTAIDEITAFLGAGSIVETQMTIANSTGPSDVTGLSFAGATYRAARIFYSVLRSTDDNEWIESGTLHAIFKTTAGTWTISGPATSDADITFSMTNAGQVQYTTGNCPGANYSGKMRFKAETMLIEV